MNIKDEKIMEAIERLEHQDSIGHSLPGIKVLVQLIETLNPEAPKKSKYILTIQQGEYSHPVYFKNKKDIDYATRRLRDIVKFAFNVPGISFKIGQVA